MVRIVALYRRPADPAAFDKHYFEVHKPIADKIPGLVHYTISRVFGSPAGKSPWYLMAELHFKDKDSFKQGMTSPEAAATAEDLQAFVGDQVEVLFVEEAPAPVAR